MPNGLIGRGMGSQGQAAREAGGGWSLGVQLTLLLAVLLLAFGALVGLQVRGLLIERERESLQRLSHGLARHIVEHWPATDAGADGRAQAEQQARRAVLAHLMAVNPGIQVYLLDADGKVEEYLGEPGMVRVPQVALEPLQAFLSGAGLPLLGTDPMGGTSGRVFSVARFPARASERLRPGYLYVVLDGAARAAVAAEVSPRRIWIGLAGVGLAGLLAVSALGALLVHRLTRPLRRLAQRMRHHGGATAAGAADARGDEVQALARAFDSMLVRIDSQAARERQQAWAQRETLAGVAHDLRTPLTALHGHLEALAGSRTAVLDESSRHLRAALLQSDRVRRLSQQLFELALLQSTDAVVQRERFHLDDLVCDTVQKFEMAGDGTDVRLAGSAPGRLELEGDLQLVERAITNLIDNAIRHARGARPVMVSVERRGPQACVLVEDGGPGLPEEVAHRLSLGLPLRDPPLARPGGGIGGLGLAIAQRVALLHGGSLSPMPSPDGGARLCLQLPLAR